MGREPARFGSGYVLGNAPRESDSKVFAAYPQELPSRAVDGLRLGKKAAEWGAVSMSLASACVDARFG